MIKVISLASIALFSSVTFAGAGVFNTIINNESMKGAPEMTKDAAFAAGKEMVMEFNSKSPFELGRSVNYATNDEVNVNSFELLNSQVTVNEIVTNEGKIAYQPVINVSYEYKARERN
ncbi:DUF3316 domain-containing protein [Vibrio atypicus]|uniref:DUF3316 domain-containing protein n=1 Tax=Vibrio atypicus TaxID=558271 RepID=UPI0037359258